MPSLVLKEYYNVKFVLAGKGPMLEYFKQKASEAGVGEKIYFTGYLDDDELKRLYGCIDIMVVPSFYEPFGITVLEGMAAGVPVVASDCGGLDEIIEHGKDGLKCRSGDAFSLAGCILDILHNPEKFAYLCDNACIKSKMSTTGIALQKKRWQYIAGSCKKGRTHSGGNAKSTYDFAL